MKLKLSLVVFCLFGLFITNANAQQKGDPPPMAVAPSEEQTKAAEGVLVALDMEQQLSSSFDKTMAQASMSIPDDKRQAFLKGMKKFIEKYCSYTAMKPGIVAIYARNFSVSELKQLAQFYQTPLGKTLAAKLPQVTAESMQFGQQIVAKHQSELQEMIMAEMK